VGSGPRHAGAAGPPEPLADGRPRDWPDRVHAVLTPQEQAAWQLSLQRSRPFGEAAWSLQTAGHLGLEHTMRPEGRPRRQEDMRKGEKDERRRQSPGRAS
jgi:hypothetical protein